MDPGDRVSDRIVLDFHAGSGGRADVYKAHDRHTGEAVAVKILRSLDSDEELLRESHALAELSHPAIVRYREHGRTANGHAYLVTEWLEGEDLSARLARGPLRLPEVLTLMRRVAEALGEAHRHGVVHRDLKPQNLFLLGGDPARVKILDFGLAQSSRRETPMTPRRAVEGSVRYMSPEQAEAIAAVDPRSDVFSLGAVLFECVTGRPAFDGDQPLAVLTKILFDQAPRIDEVRTGVPAGLVELTARMLSRNREDRPTDGLAVCAAIDALRTGPVRESERILATRSLSPVERHPTAMLLVRGAPIAIVEAAAAQDGLRAHTLGDGSIVLSHEGASGGELAAHVTRAGRRLAAASPDARIGVVMGAEPIDDLVERASGLLQRSHEPMVIDPVVASLLPEAMRVSESGAGARHAGGLGSIPYLGRQRELGTLLATLRTSVHEPSARVVVVIGAPGIGKSRLLRELFARAHDEGIDVTTWTSHADPLRAGAPYSLVASALSMGLGLRGAETPEAQAMRLRSHLARRLPRADLTRVTEFLAELLGISLPIEPSIELRAARRDPMIMADQIQRAFGDLMSAWCGEGPLAICLEDLHWADAASLKLLAETLRRCETRALFIIATARDGVRERFPTLFAGRSVREVILGPLPERTARELIHAALGDAATPDEAATLAQRGAGNPLHLEEIARAFATGNHDTAPETVVAMLHARLESLERDARALLRAASVFGTRFWREGVTHMLGGVGAKVRVDEWLATLESREVVTGEPQSRLPGQAEYAFRHALMAEAAYGLLTEEDRRLGHRMAAEWLIAAGEAEPVVIAEHFSRGGADALAVPYWHRAARQALWRVDLESAVTYGEAGVRGGASGALLGAIEAVLAEAHRWRGEYAAAQHHAASALTRLPIGCSDWSMAATTLASALHSQAPMDELNAHAHVLLAVAPEASAESVHALAKALVKTAMISNYSGRADLAASLRARFAELTVGHGGFDDPALEAELHTLDASDWAGRGELDRFLECCKLAAGSFRRAGDRGRALAAEVNAGYALRELGQYDLAHTHLRALVKQCEELGVGQLTDLARNNLGAVLAHLGRFDEAVRLEDAVATHAATAGHARMEGGARLYLALIHSLRGKPVEAIAQAELAIGLLSRTSLPIVPYALAILARALLERGDSARALTVASEAMEHLERMGRMEGSEALLRLAYAEALFAVGDHDGARRAIAEASRRLDERSARIGNVDFRTSFLERVPEHAATRARAREWSTA